MSNLESHSRQNILSSLHRLSVVDVKANLRTSVTISLPQLDFLIHINASKVGWAAHLGHLREQGLCTSSEAALYIKFFELEVLHLHVGLEAFQQIAI